MSKLIRQAIVDEKTRKLINAEVNESVQADDEVSQLEVATSNYLGNEVVSRETAQDGTDDDEAYLVNAEREASERGYQAGFEQGKNDAEKQLSKTLDLANEIILSLNSSKDSYLEEVRQEMIAVVHEAVLKIVGLNLTSIIERTLLEIIENTGTSHLVSICLNQSDYKYLISNETFSSLHRFLKIDSRVTNGGCIVENQFGGIDARVETQLEEFTNLLVEHVEKNAD